MAARNTIAWLKRGFWRAKMAIIMEILLCTIILAIFFPSLLRSSKREEQKLNTSSIQGCIKGCSTVRPSLTIQIWFSRAWQKILRAHIATKILLVFHYVVLVFTAKRTNCKFHQVTIFVIDAIINQHGFCIQFVMWIVIALFWCFNVLWGKKKFWK